MAINRWIAILLALLAGTADAPLVGKAWADAFSNTAPAPPARALDVKSRGAVGDGVTDDSAAISAAITAAIAQPNGARADVYLPAGSYKITATAMPLITKPIRIHGDGPHKTYLVVDKTYTGDLFAVSEAWSGAAYTSGMLPPSDNAGFQLDGMTIFGDTTSTANGSVMAFYDRNDYVLVKDVEAFYFNSSCIAIGAARNTAIGYMRESKFDNVRCFNTGSTSLPAVDISSTTTITSDATNELQFFKLHIFASAGKGLTIRNPNAWNSTRLLEFFAPRVEFSGANNIEIGSTSDTGQIASIRMYGLESITPGAANAGFYGLQIDGGSIQPYDVMVMGGQIGPCWTATACKGVNINNTRLTKIQVENISTTGTNVTAGANLGIDTVIDGNGAEQNWTYAINAAVLKNVRTAIYKQGDPTTASGTTTPPSLTMGIHDGTATFGNPVGSGAVDLQVVRNNANQVASQPGSAIIGGAFNAIGGNGSQAMIMGGSTNVLNGLQGFIGAGAQANDRGRPDTQSFSAGQFTTTGDAQTVLMMLRNTNTGATAGRLTADNAAAGSLNCVNIPNNAAYNLRITLHARDFTTAGTDYDWTLPTGIMTRDASAATTAVSLGTPVIISRGTVTGAAVTATADTTNGCLNLSFTPPTGNTDTWHVAARVQTVEVQ